jgi:hypothetical protein
VLDEILKSSSESSFENLPMNVKKVLPDQPQLIEIQDFHERLFNMKKLKKNKNLIHQA